MGNHKRALTTADLSTLADMLAKPHATMELYAAVDRLVQDVIQRSGSRSQPVREAPR